jgi:hypothetical protein
LVARGRRRLERSKISLWEHGYTLKPRRCPRSGCTFQALREQLRCKEIWVVGADKWRNPAEDLPADFEDRRAEHYQALRKPLDATAFIDQLLEEMRTELDALHHVLPKADWLSISLVRREQSHLLLLPLFDVR